MSKFQHTLLVVLLCASGCGYGSSSLPVTRAVSAPAPVPISPTALPMDGHAGEAYLGSSSIWNQGEYREGSDGFGSNSSMRIARFSLDGGVRRRLSRNWTGGVGFQYGTPRWSKRIGSDFDPKLGDFFAGHLQVNWRALRGQAIEFVTGARLSMAAVPGEFTSAVGSGSGHEINSQMDLHVTVVVPVSDDATLFVGGNLLNAHQADTGAYQQGDPEPKATTTELIGTLSFGVRGKLMEQLDLVIAGHLPAQIEPVNYPFSLGAYLVRTFGSSEKRKPARLPRDYRWN